MPAPHQVRDKLQLASIDFFMNYLDSRFRGNDATLFKKLPDS